MKQVCVGMAGGGYGAFLHLNGYKKIHGLDVRLKTVVDIELERAQVMAKTYGFEKAVIDFEEMLKDDEIDVIDIVTPPHLHLSMAERALKAGKHVICEKPLTGYFGEKDDNNRVGEVPKSKMYKKLIIAMNELKEVVSSSGRKFMYAENHVYCTPIQKAAEIIRAKKSKILFIKGEQSLKGSSSAVAGEWKYTGGGCLIRGGIHPLGAALWIKQQEAIARGESIAVESVVAEIGNTLKSITEHEHRHIAAHPKDVEDFASVTVNFSDGTRALIISSDTVLGGSNNYLQVYCNDAALDCKITATDLLGTYFLDEDGLEDIYLAEMLPSKLGWNRAFVSDEVIRGYTGELQDFIECIGYEREPLSGFDLAYQSIQVIYAAYQSAEEGRRISL